MHFVKLTTNVVNPAGVKVIDCIKEDWCKVGISATTWLVDFNELVSNLQDSCCFNCILLGWGSGVPPDPLMSCNILLLDSMAHHLGRWKHHMD